MDVARRICTRFRNQPKNKDKKKTEEKQSKSVIVLTQILLTYKFGGSEIVTCERDYGKEIQFLRRREKIWNINEFASLHLYIIFCP